MEKAFIVEAITGNSTEPLLPSKVSYACNLSCADDELKNFRSCLRWICVNQYNAKHVMVSWSRFLLLGIFDPTASHFVLSYAPTRRSSNGVVQLSLTFASDLSYLCLFALVPVVDAASPRLLLNLQPSASATTRHFAPNCSQPLTRSVCTLCIALATVIRLLTAIELPECKKFCPKRAKFHPNLEQVFDSFGRLWDCVVFSIIFVTYSYE
ncbi:hypothetical protein GW17_00041765 [Ensete ventricosum]|nr:hypothetical protein GW17_00041765 [Ensete ventricosum]RZR91770.1 hypothetical protein BHM03_00019955 [Ensete ventricosum]